MKTRWKILLAVLTLLLAGCNTDLYTNLDEADANQMMALLMYYHIPAEKVAAKNGITLRVDQARFVDAVEVLRQNGFPRHKTVSMEDLFPSGQLVSSPEQEAAKLMYLKSQQLEKMLASMDGVINAEVSVASPRLLPDSDQKIITSAAVFIKYSPEVNLAAREAEIRNLVLNGIPDITSDHISISLQRAEYRYMPDTAPTPKRNYLPLMSVVIGGVLLIIGFATWLLLGRRKAATA
ncbi:EscJ/YscJ/HrcJ family type III secretion inner membrane ring protein [Dyella sp. M7H15-1]|uniref:type III secretion system inner membrane ring lipoprotein SctJ n=1 Tax=Dyella sp. M7H15-1 TaxID=2501295 RepID=UPI00100511D1|nr:type III secretion inner membrane ring lipoprotein SctJ [Dyella sp. M7H15-1]QAU24830.1 EscJ/YscJ/HrcJ family type III secretion inner membrane ring protein [Dyella sp. M7H15-1]